MTVKVDRCLEKVGNRFMLATLVARRWEQLVTGGRPMVKTRDPRSIQTVLREIDDELLKLNDDTMLIERFGEPVEPEIPFERGDEEAALAPQEDDEDDADDEEEE